MKAKPFKYNPETHQYDACEPKEATHLHLMLPCKCNNLMLPVMVGGTRAGTPNWTWNGDCEHPTVKPSVLTTGTNYRCHSFINDGQMQFLADTGPTGEKGEYCLEENNHAGLAGKVLPLLEVE